MYVGAALGVINAIAGALYGQRFFSAYSAASDGSAHASYFGGAIVGGAIVVGLWCWMAWKNRQGRPWARVLSTVLFAIMCLDALGSLFALTLAPVPAIATIAEWAAGLAAIIFIWNRESSRYYQAMKAPPGYAPVPPGYGRPPE